MFENFPDDGFNLFFGEFSIAIDVKLFVEEFNGGSCIIRAIGDGIGKKLFDLLLIEISVGV